MTDTDSREPYETRYGFTPKTVLALLGSAVYTAFFAFLIAVLAPDALSGQAEDRSDLIWMLLLALLSVVLFGGGGLLMLAGALSRQVALRVDHDGVTLGPQPRPFGRSRSFLTPWSDIDAVVLFRQDVGRFNRSMRGPWRYKPYIALRVHRDAVPARSAPRLGRIMRRVTSALLPHVPPGDLRVACPINGWRFDRARLLEAVTAYAPRVRVVDIDDEGSQRTLTPPVHPL